MFDETQFLNDRIRFNEEMAAKSLDSVEERLEWALEWEQKAQTFLAMGRERLALYCSHAAMDTLRMGLTWETTLRRFQQQAEEYRRRLAEIG